MRLSTEAVADEVELRRLAESPDPDERIAAAENASCPSEVLNRLAKDQWENFGGIAGVRVTVAENRNTPSETLRDLADDSDWNVRARVAGNRNTPGEVLVEFLAAEIEFIEVRTAAAGNTSTPTSTLHSAACGEYEDEWFDGYDEDDLADIRSAVAANASTSHETLALLAVDPSAEVRRAVHANPNATLEIRTSAALLGLDDE